MSSKSKVIVSGVLAAIIAVSLIGAVVFTPGILNSSTLSSSSHSTVTSSTASASTQNSAISSAQSGSSSSSSSSSSSESSSSGGGSGTLAVLMTDPPTVPQGVTAVYINYSSMEIHIANAGNDSGWTDLRTSGSIDLMSIVNESQNIATTNVSSGKFNGLRFNVTSAVVTFNGANYTADLVYQEHTLNVWIPGGIYISNGQTTGAMIDLTPTVLLLGNTTAPTFAFLPAATGYTLPSNSIPNHPHVGDRDDWKNKQSEAIWQMTKFELTAASISSTSLSVNVWNNGNATIIFRMVVVTSTTGPSEGWIPSTPLGPASKTSEFFVIVPNGTLIPITASTKEGAENILALSGYALAPGTGATFTFNGQVTLGGFAMLQGDAPTHGVVAGEKYIITVLGSGQHAQTAVTAGTPTTSTTTSIPVVTSTSTSTVTTTPTSTSTSTSSASSSQTSSSTAISSVSDITVTTLTSTVTATSRTTVTQTSSASSSTSTSTSTSASTSSSTSSSTSQTTTTAITTSTTTS